MAHQVVEPGTVLVTVMPQIDSWKLRTGPYQKRRPALFSTQDMIDDTA
jgi:hypothetical protein